MDQDKLSWQGYEFEYKEKTPDWFWAVGIITISLAVIAVIYNDPLFAVFMLIAGFTIFMSAKKEPQLINFEINTKGIKINKTLYPYTNIKSFWVEESEYMPPKIILRVNKLITPIIVVTVDTNLLGHDHVRDYLLKYVTEEKLLQPFSHRITEYLGL